MVAVIETQPGQPSTDPADLIRTAAIRRYPDGIWGVDLVRPATGQEEYEEFGTPEEVLAYLSGFMLPQGAVR